MTYEAHRVSHYVSALIVIIITLVGYSLHNTVFNNYLY